MPPTIPRGRDLVVLRAGRARARSSWRTRETDAEQEEAPLVASAAVFTFFHEMGHALIAIYDLPVTGREEARSISSPS